MIGLFNYELLYNYIMTRLFIKIDENIDYELEKNDYDKINDDYFSLIKKFIFIYSNITDIIDEINRTLYSKNIKNKEIILKNIKNNINIIKQIVKMSLDIINDETDNRYNISIEELIEREIIEREYNIFSYNKVWN